jgi:hypothetical protein
MGLKKKVQKRDFLKNPTKMKLLLQVVGKPKIDG